MVVQLGFLRDALIEAGASEAAAGKAAEEMAGYENAFAEVRSDIAALKSDIATLRAETKTESASIRGEFRAEIASLRGELALLKWMLASIFGLLVAVALKIFLH